LTGLQCYILHRPVGRRHSRRGCNG